VKTLKEFQDFFANNINHVIEEANKNEDCPGYAILLPHYSINTADINHLEEFGWLWYDLEDEFHIALTVNQYDDLCVFTEKCEEVF